MNETITTIVGNVVDAPSRRLLESGVCVTSFRVASTARRFDRVTNRWADGDSLYLKVTCWRALAENTAASVVKGDPVVVTGRLYTRLYSVAESQRAAYELEATAIGFDFNRGRATFQRVSSSRASLTVDETGADGLPSGGAVDAHIDTAVKPVERFSGEERNPFHDDPIDDSAPAGPFDDEHDSIPSSATDAPTAGASTAGVSAEGRVGGGIPSAGVGVPVAPHAADAAVAGSRDATDAGAPGVNVGVSAAPERGPHDSTEPEDGPRGNAAAHGGPHDSAAAEGGPHGSTAPEGGLSGSTAPEGGSRGSAAGHGGPRGGAASGSGTSGSAVTGDATDGGLGAGSAAVRARAGRPAETPASGDVGGAAGETGNSAAGQGTAGEGTDGSTGNDRPAGGRTGDTGSTRPAARRRNASPVPA